MAAQTSEQGQDHGQFRTQDLEQEREQVQAHGQEQAQVKAEQPKDTSQGLDQTLALLRAKDDTSRFVGLALLKSILDNKVDCSEDPEMIRRCWAAIPAKFLDRLLRAPRNEDRSKEESLSMVGLAVAVLHTFIVLFSRDLGDDEKSVGRIERLIDILAWSPADTRTQILQILLTLTSTKTGSTAVLCAAQWAHLVDLAPQTHLALEVIKFAFANTPFQILQKPDVQLIVNETLSSLVSSSRDTSQRPLAFQALHDLFYIIPLNVLPPSPSWLSSIATLIRQNCLSPQGWTSLTDRKPTVLLTGSLLHIFPTEFGDLLFDGSSTSAVSQDPKPVSYLFIKLLLIDLRGDIPTLRVGVNSDSLPALDRIAASYDIISAFIGFLIHLLDEEDIPPDPDNEINQPSASPFAPSLLLQLRVDISEAMSLTIENLHDRLENSIFHAVNLHLIAPSRSRTTSSAPTQHDTLTISQIRTLALWLREDDNEALRKEAASITNILLDLYGKESYQMLEFRYSVLTALEGIIKVPEGVEAFLAADGWVVLSGDLRAILTAAPSSEYGRGSFARGIDIVRVLLDVVESDFVGPAKEDWMEIVELASTPSPSSPAVDDPLSPHIRRADLLIATAQLAVELLVRAPRNVRVRSMPAAGKVLHMARDVLLQEDENSGAEVRVVGTSREARDGAKEVVKALQGLGIRCV